MADQKDSLDREKLESLLLLKGVDLESIRGLLEDCPVQQLKRGEVLIHAEKPNQFLYLLVSGRLRIHLKLELDSIAILEPGEVVGELSLIDRQLTSAYVVAAEDCRLLVIDDRTMWSLVASCHAVARNLLVVLAQRLRHGNSILLTAQHSQPVEDYAVFDVLTGLYNRQGLDALLPREMDRCSRKGSALSSLMLEIDDFSSYRDSHGNRGGDRVLYTIARTLRESMSDSEMIARYSGNQFLVLLPDAEVEAGWELGGQLHGAASKAKIYLSDRRPLPPVTISGGLAQLTAGDTPLSFIAAAKWALHQAKREGGNRLSKVDRPG